MKSVLAFMAVTKAVQEGTMCMVPDGDDSWTPTVIPDITSYNACDARYVQAFSNEDKAANDYCF